MAQNPITLGHTYTFDETGKFKIGPLTEGYAEHALRDGRIAGLLVEHMVCAWFFPNVARNADERGQWDVSFKDMRFEVRTVTSGGVSLLPSSQMGVGRKYDEQKFLDKLAGIDGYCFVDVTQSPLFQVVFVSIDIIPLVKRLSYVTWCNLVIKT